MQNTIGTPSWAEQDISQPATQHKAKSSGSQWQTLNVSPDLVKALLVRKFKNPTPIQRASIPGALSAPPRDILGMARTGSGKTLAYLIPLLQRLGPSHSSSASPRALILCPSRELAVQIFSVGKDLARGMGKGKAKEIETLRWALIMGGESLEGQFEKMSAEPDMLFEMGFDAQLREILVRLPSTRQNLLFSATLPSTVAEFAKAGLVNPLLIRLDADHKISSDLDLRFLSVKPLDKDAALLVLLKDAIRITSKSDVDDASPQAIVFVSTKHHVDYISELLRAANYRTSHIYSSLDQTARQQQMHQFRTRSTDVLVVTDVAARGLDIPVMDHVINYDFPPGPRVFVHRVGRTARAGRKGTAWSLITRDDWPYLYDLQTFLGISRIGDGADMLKALPTDNISENVEYILSSLDEVSPNLISQREVMRKGQSMFERSRGKASVNAYRKAKVLGQELARQQSLPVDRSFSERESKPVSIERDRLIASLATYTPNETVFEMGRKGDTENAILMQKRRKIVSARKNRLIQKTESSLDQTDSDQAQAPTQEPRSFRDPEFFMDHAQSGAASEQGYSLKSGASLPEALSAATVDLTADEGSATRAQKASQLNWDRKKRKFITTTIGSDNAKMIRSESGALLPATYSSGRYDSWKKTRRLGAASNSNARHSKTPPGDVTHQGGDSDADKGRKNSDNQRRGTNKSLLTADVVRKQRLQTRKKLEKTARPSRKSGRS
ncbi:uncharacterized protein IL334_002001 [Kwoniella shivajii]|uniref:RNA helicase n=1 Tax=Kwoniella shivajii TaxID=564305 RepID=A0ABZ1CV51_9TREE|nr:hypothetical protein IL334_002001 [Kwoniella shivajii]